MAGYGSRKVADPFTVWVGNLWHGTPKYLLLQQLSLLGLEAAAVRMRHRGTTQDADTVARKFRIGKSSREGRGVG